MADLRSTTSKNIGEKIITQVKKQIIQNFGVLSRGDVCQPPIRREIKQGRQLGLFSVDCASQMSTIIESFSLRLVTKLAGRATDVLQHVIQFFQRCLVPAANERSQGKRK